MMIDGRFDQQFAEIFAASQEGDGARPEPVLLRAAVMACVAGIVLSAIIMVAS